MLRVHDLHRDLGAVHVGWSALLRSKRAVTLDATLLVGLQETEGSISAAVASWTFAVGLKSPVVLYDQFIYIDWTRIYFAGTAAPIRTAGIKSSAAIANTAQRTVALPAIGGCSSGRIASVTCFTFLALFARGVVTAVLYNERKFIHIGSRIRRVHFPCFWSIDKFFLKNDSIYIYFIWNNKNSSISLKIHV